MGQTLVRYGMGRTRQFYVSGWRPTFHQVLPLVLLATIGVLVHWGLWTEFVVLWFIAAGVVAVTCQSLLQIWKRVVAGLIAPLIPMPYAAGQVAGWFALLVPAPVAPVEITLRNERGEPI